MTIENHLNQNIEDPIERQKIVNSSDSILIKRVETHMGSEFLNMPKDIAAGFDTGDFDNSDPRIRASKKIIGEVYGQQRNKHRSI